MSGGLEQLSVLLGEWTGSSKAFSEGHARMSVALTEDGRYVRIDSKEDDKRFPEGTQLIGGDDARDECTVLYYDERGVRRVYNTSVEGGVWRVWREAPGFNQRYIGRISEDGRSIAGQWEFSEDGKDWKVDFDLNYEKIG